MASIFVAILTVYVMLSYLIELKKIKFIHESTVAIAMGVLTAVFCKYVSLDLLKRASSQQYHFRTRFSLQ